MDIDKILVELRQEREHIDSAIVAFERLARSGGRRRGRPPAWMADSPAKRRSRPPGANSKATPES
jgi:hypothetical protein